MFSKSGQLLLTSDGKTVFPAQLEEIFQSATKPENAAKDIVIWVHGGLVAKESAEHQIDEIGPNLDAQGAFPIFMIWQSGLASALPDAVIAFLIRKVANEGVQLLTNLIQAKLSFGGLLGVDAVENDKYELNEFDRQAIEEAVKASPELMTEQRYLFEENHGLTHMNILSEVAPSQDQKRAEASLKPQIKTMDNAFKKAVRDEQKTANFAGGLQLAILLGKVAIAVLRRYKNHREHELRSTILEELSRLAELPADVWNDMKRDAEAHFEPGGAGLELLGVVKRALDLNQNRKVFLVGHSTGGVMIDKILSTKNLPVNTFHVRLLASAARLEKTATAYTTKSGNTIASIRSFMLDPNDEAGAFLVSEWETKFNKDWLNPLYKGSLLYFVSGALEAPSGDVPLTGMVRFESNPAFLSADEHKFVESFGKEVRNRDSKGFVVANTPGAEKGYQSGAKKHGDFSTDPNTLGSILMVP